MNITETTQPVPDYEIVVHYATASSTWKWAVHELSDLHPYACQANCKAWSNSVTLTRWGATRKAKRAMRRLIRRRTRLYTVTLEEKS